MRAGSIPLSQETDRHRPDLVAVHQGLDFPVILRRSCVRCASAVPDASALGSLDVLRRRNDRRCAPGSIANAVPDAPLRCSGGVPHFSADPSGHAAIVALGPSRVSRGTSAGRRQRGLLPVLPGAGGRAPGTARIGRGRKRALRTSSRPCRANIWFSFATDHSTSCHEEWVYNGADIDAATIIWAREMSPSENRKLVDLPRPYRLVTGSQRTTGAASAVDREPWTVNRGVSVHGSRSTVHAARPISPAGESRSSRGPAFPRSR